MAELIVLSLFMAGLVISLIFTGSVISALIFGFVLFFSFGLYRGYSLKDLGRASWESARKVSNIIIVMLLIGALTASWRSSGTIAYLVTIAADLISPAFCLLSAFWLNAALSTLIGTSFGTAATMGVVTMTMCVSMGISPFWAGGAILAGAFTGDRCSPVSTSAQLVCLVTSTDLYRNMALMVKTGWLPFLLSSLIYLLVNFSTGTTASSSNAVALFSKEFALNLYCLIPAVVMFGLVALKADIKITISAAIAAAAAVTIFVQGVDPKETAEFLIRGFTAKNAGAGALMNGGGLISMVSVSFIILVSCTYAGLFELTGLLRNIEKYILSIRARCGKFAAIVFTALVTAMVSCNQMLCVILTEQLCKKVEPDRQKMAIALEDTAIVIPPLIPWSIAGAVPVATVGAPTECVFAALFLIFLPLFGIIREKLWNKG